MDTGFIPVLNWMICKCFFDEYFCNARCFRKKHNIVPLMKRILKYWKWIAAAVILFIALIIYANISIVNSAKSFEYKSISDIPACQAAMVLGARVNKNGTLALMTLDRANMSIDLYNAGKVKKILVSGDHGHVGYDEVN